MDLGECSKIHDVALIPDYNEATKTHDYFYDVDVCKTDFLLFKCFLLGLLID